MSEAITCGIYVLARNGRLKVGYSAQPYLRLRSHRTKLRQFDLLGFIPGNREIDAATRNRLIGGPIAPTKDWFPDTPDNREILNGLGLKDYALIEGNFGILRVSPPLLRELKVRAAVDGLTLQAAADEAVRKYLETKPKSKVKPS